LREDDSDTRIRYLSPEEQERLFVALNAREERIKAGRDNHNEWLDARDRKQLPDLKNAIFVDHLMPMVVVSLNTGIRRKSLFELRWSDINFQEEVLTVRPPTEKSGKLVHIPMNEILTKTLSAWKDQTGGVGDDLVFPSPKTGEMMNNCNSAWERLLQDADIKDFRWHDMRHDFASQLVMGRADLNTVRELMGHSDIKMTLRYAHLAPAVKQAAVDLLG
jgi:integrase